MIYFKEIAKIMSEIETDKDGKLISDVEAVISALKLIIQDYEASKGTPKGE